VPQIQLLSGIFTDTGADFRRSYPLNLTAVPLENGISKGYLRTADGMVEFANSIFSGASDRGAINWQGICYRVIGEWLTRVNANQTIDYLGQVADDGKRCVIVNGFDRLAISSGGNLYYWSPTLGLVQVTDPDLGLVLDVVWAAGYYLTTDGEFIVQSELNDPLEFNPLKYGSSEASPDPINSLLFIRNELVAINRYTVEYFDNIGGSGFAWQRIEGAMIPKGSIGTHASTYYLESFAFVGGGYNEGLSVYLAGPGQVVKLATREIETILQGYTEAELAGISTESRADKVNQFLYIHLPDQTLVYDAAASEVVGEPVWTVHTSGEQGQLSYRARNFVQCYGKWLFGDNQSLKIGYLTPDDARQFGQTVPWQFDTVLLYNEGRGAVFHDLELVRLPGRQSINPLLPAPTQDATVFLSYTDNGLSWSNPRSSLKTRPGNYEARTCWRRLGHMKQWRGMRLRGMNNPYPDAFTRLEAVIEQLSA
jgi:hypothetical protein